MNTDDETGQSAERRSGQDDVDQQIVLCPDGPLLVRGDFEIRDARGQTVAPHRQTVALCRCGGSGIKPFCDGTHKVNGFRTEP
ncbi:CDGSH iron-sulfur domain-containing protein [Arthrobacter sp. JSM 101049]|uniref:CDGSH iron-sulfur domain-containing protein n=1 Tax=Arthrobacter sp. JSM 101049 TaxID=929097 RepID=UPI0035693657